eukprot:253583_1
MFTFDCHQKRFALTLQYHHVKNNLTLYTAYSLLISVFKTKIHLSQLKQIQNCLTMGCCWKVILLFTLFLSIYGVSGTQNPTADPTVEPTMESMDPTLEPTIQPTQTIRSISCNETVFGNTKFEGDIAYYSLINTNNQNGTYFQIETLGSQYNTALFLFDGNWKEIISGRKCSPNWNHAISGRSCDSATRMNLPLKLYDNEYIIGIGGFHEDHTQGLAFGDYVLTIHCDSHQSFVNDSYQPDCIVSNNIYICECLGDNRCNGAIINCKDNMDCILKCNGQSACLLI